MTTWPPKKLPKDFPLTVHVRGYVKSGIGWICGKKTPQEALAIYHRKAQEKLSKKKPALTITSGDDQTVEQLAERYVGVRKDDAAAGDIRLVSYRQIAAAMAELVEHVIGEDVPGIGGTSLAETAVADLTPDHFSDFAQAMRKKGGEAFARKKCRLVVGLFRHASEEDWISRPIKFGRRFRQVAWSKPEPFKSIPPTRAEVGAMLAYMDRELRKFEKQRSKRKNKLDTRSLRMFKAGFLLALNGGYGSSELAQLPTAILDLDNALIDYRRGKTGKEHVVPLWPESVAALRDVFEDIERSRPGDDLVFRTREGRPWAYEQPKRDADGELEFVSCVDNFSQRFNKIARKCKCKRINQSFYSLKDLHCSISDEHIDQPAAYKLTGHQYHTGGRDPYVTVTIERLRKVVEFLRQRILPAASTAAVAAGRAGRGSPAGGGTKCSSA